MLGRSSRRATGAIERPSEFLHLLPARARRDANWLQKLQRMYEHDLRVCGANKVWRQVRREDTVVARCRAERLIRRLALQIDRGGKGVCTTVPDAQAACQLDRVNWRF